VADHSLYLLFGCKEHHAHDSMQMLLQELLDDQATSHSALTHDKPVSRYVVCCLDYSHFCLLVHGTIIAARLITRTRRREHITPVLRELHWLPVRQCIDFKFLCARRYTASFHSTWLKIVSC